MDQGFCVEGVEEWGKEAFCGWGDASSVDELPCKALQSLSRNADSFLEKFEFLDDGVFLLGGKAPGTEVTIWKEPQDFFFGFKASVAPLHLLEGDGVFAPLVASDGRGREDGMDAKQCSPSHLS